VEVDSLRIALENYIALLRRGKMLKGVHILNNSDIIRYLVKYNIKWHSFEIE
jgi:hypothetical protein